MNIRNICGFYAELRIAMRNSALQCGTLQGIQDMRNFFHISYWKNFRINVENLQRIQTWFFYYAEKCRNYQLQTNFAAENILEKFLVRKFWTWTILHVENIGENLFHLIINEFFFLSVSDFIRPQFCTNSPFAMIS